MHWQPLALVIREINAPIPHHRLQDTDYMAKTAQQRLHGNDVLETGFGVHSQVSFAGLGQLSNLVSGFWRLLFACILHVWVNYSILAVEAGD